MSGFDTTHWSVILRARGGAGEAREALEDLCRTYRTPVLAYIRRCARGGDAAEDLTQAFFVHFLEKETFSVADPQRGRFRAFLLTAVKRFLINAHAETQAAKRGGGVQFDSIDESVVGGLLGRGETPDQAFERSWAMIVLEGALRRLRSEAQQAGKQALFEHLREFLTEAPDDADYTRVAAALNLRRNTLAVAVHRMRHRLRELVRIELAQSTSSRGDLECELRELRGALGAAMQADTEIAQVGS